jgi:tetratricopeptide (TPR) repeat protein
MPEYLWSGTSPSGEQGAAERVQADNIEAAKAILISRGWTNLQFHKGEIHSYVKTSMAANRGYKLHLTPKEELRVHKGGNSAFFHHWWHSLVQHKFNLTIFALIVLYGIFRQQMWLASFFGALLLLYILLFPIGYFRASGSNRLFRKLVTARNWYRWDEVLQCVEQFKKRQQTKKMGIGRAQLARYSAQALAGTGRLEEAIKIFNEETASANMPEWLRLSQIGTIYHVAGQFDNALEYRRRAATASTDDASPVVGLANYLVEHFSFVDESKALLAKVETKTLCDIGSTALPKLRGIIAYRENDFRSADRYLREALAGMEKKAQARYHLFERSLLTLNGQLAVVNAALGNRAEAEKFFKNSCDFLVATKRQDLIDAYHRFSGSRSDS